MGKSTKNNRNLILEILSIIIIPISIYWILVRRGLLVIVDVLAMGVVIGFIGLWAFKWLAEQKIITFDKK